MGGTTFSHGWCFHPGLKVGANVWSEIAVLMPSFSLGWYYQPGLKGRGVRGQFRPRR
jgi:hypothetical protein